MSRSRFSSLVAVACIALAAVSAPVIDAAYAAVGVARYCWEAVAARLFGDPAKSERIIGAAISRPRVTLVSAKAFRDRLAKRERPVVFPSWRMCPTV